jgi:hypothetical protein
MPAVRVIRKFVQVPDTWEAWAVRVLTIAVVVTIGVAVILLQQTAELRSLIVNGRAERNTYQNDQTYRVCMLLREHNGNPVDLKAAKC